MPAAFPVISVLDPRRFQDTFLLLIAVMVDRLAKRFLPYGPLAKPASTRAGLPSSRPVQCGVFNTDRGRDFAQFEAQGFAATRFESCSNGPACGCDANLRSRTNSAEYVFM